jgi:hypothetical protein
MLREAKESTRIRDKCRGCSSASANSPSGIFAADASPASPTDGIDKPACQQWEMLVESTRSQNITVPGLRRPSLPNFALARWRSLSLGEGADDSDRRSGWHPR